MSSKNVQSVLKNIVVNDFSIMFEYYDNFSTISKMVIYCVNIYILIKCDNMNNSKFIDTLDKKTG